MGTTKNKCHVKELSGDSFLEGDPRMHKGGSEESEPRKRKVNEGSLMIRMHLGNHLRPSEMLH